MRKKQDNKAKPANIAVIDKTHPLHPEHLRGIQTFAGDKPAAFHTVSITASKKGVMVRVQEDDRDSVLFEFTRRGGRRLTIQKPQTGTGK